MVKIKTSKANPVRGSPYLELVEMTRVELVSENHLPELSTSIAYGLTFPLRRAHKQAQRISSLSVMTGAKASSCSRSPLIDAFIQAAVLPVKTAALIRLRTPSHNCSYS